MTLKTIPGWTMGTSTTRAMKEGMCCDSGSLGVPFANDIARFTQSQSSYCCIDVSLHTILMTIMMTMRLFY